MKLQENEKNFNIIYSLYQEGVQLKYINVYKKSLNKYIHRMMIKSHNYQTKSNEKEETVETAEAMIRVINNFHNKN